MAQDRFTQDGVVYEALPNGNVRVVGYAEPQAAPRGGQVFTLPQNPVEAARERAGLISTQVNTARTQADIQRDAARDAREQAKADREALEWGATHNPDGTPKAQLTRQQVGAARQKLQGLNSIAAQINRVENALDAAERRGFTGPLWGRIPGTGSFDAESAVLDKSIAQLAPLIRQLTRTPGEGSMSDYESRLATLALPSRSDNPAAVREAISGIRELLGQTSAGYGELLSSAGEKVPDMAAVGASNGGEVPPPDAGGTYSAATGSTRNERDPKLSGFIDRMIRSGATAEQINSQLPPGATPVNQDLVGAWQRYLKANPGYKGGTADATFQTTNTLMNQISGSPLAAGISSAADAIVPMKLLAGEQGARAVDAMQAANPGPSLAGTIAGGTLAAAGAELGAVRALGAGSAWAPRLGDAMYGAFQGFGNADDGDGLTGAATGAGAGVVGGMIGRNTIRAAAGAAGGARNATTDYLRTRGVPLTVGQLVGNGGRLGQAVKGIEDRLTGVPLLGDAVNARRREGFEGFSRAMFDEGLSPIGVKPADIAEQGVEQGQQAVSDAYTQALSGVNVTPDPQFTADLGAARSAGRAIPRTGPEFDHVVSSRIDPFLQQGSFDGPAIQDAIQGLRKANFGNDAMGSAASDAAGSVEDALGGLVSRQAPDVMPRLGAANSAYRNLSVISDAVGRAANAGGVPTPAQLGMAARANAKKFGGKMNAATTRRPFFDLQRAGQEVLPSQVPDSGTAGRLALASLILPSALGGAGAGVGALGGDASGGAGLGLGLGGLLAVGGTKAGQKILTGAIADRPDALVRIADHLKRRARIGGIFGAPLLAQGVSDR